MLLNGFFWPLFRKHFNFDESDVKEVNGPKIKRGNACSMLFDLFFPCPPVVETPVICVVASGLKFTRNGTLGCLMDLYVA